MAGSQALNFTLIPRCKASIIRTSIKWPVASGLGSSPIARFSL